MSEFKVGRRVRSKQVNGGLSLPFVDKVGVISMDGGFADVWVRLDAPVMLSREWLFPIRYLELLPFSPEEQAQWEEEERQREDQERRRQHADRYL